MGEAGYGLCTSNSPTEQYLGDLLPVWVFHLSTERDTVSSGVGSTMVGQFGSMRPKDGCFGFNDCC